MKYTLNEIEQLLTFSDEDLKSIQYLVSDLSDNYGDITYQEIYNIVTFPKHLKKKNNIFKTNIFNLFKKYQTILNKIFKTGLLRLVVDVSKGMLYSYDFDGLLDNIMYSNDEGKKIILDNLKRIKELGISELSYSRSEHMKNRINVMELGEQGDPHHILFGFYSDGTPKWEKSEGQIEYEICGVKNKIYVDNSYEVCIEDMSYIIEFIKTSQGITKITMTLSKLNFDAFTLPSYKELYDLNIWQKLGDERTEAIENINVLINSSETLKRNFEEIEKRLTILQGTEHYKEALQMAKKLCNMTNNLAVIAANSYKESEIITEEDFQRNFQK